MNNIAERNWWALNSLYACVCTNVIDLFVASRLSKTCMWTSTHLLVHVQSKLHVVSYKHLPRPLLANSRGTNISAARSKVGVRSEGVAFHSVSYMAVPIGEVNYAIIFEQTAFSKIHEPKTLKVSS